MIRTQIYHALNRHELNKTCLIDIMTMRVVGLGQSRLVMHKTTGPAKPNKKQLSPSPRDQTVQNYKMGHISPASSPYGARGFEAE